MDNYNYIRTDLAAESPVIEKGDTAEGIKAIKETARPCSIITVKVTSEEGERLIGRPIGTYVTLGFPKPWLMSDSDLDLTARCIARHIRSLACGIFKNNSTPSVLIAGLGNRYITSDAIGPLTVKAVTVTSHLRHRDPELFSDLRTCSVSAIAPGVLGQTGIETYDLIKNAVDSTSPDLLIVIDALASKSVDRLATTVQLSDTGIAPGSGIGNKRSAINKDTVGIPVIAVGVPTMVDSATLIFNALEKAGISDISDGLKAVLDNGKSFFVTLNDSDTAVASLSDLLARSLNLALSLDQKTP